MIRSIESRKWEYTLKNQGTLHINLLIVIKIKDLKDWWRDHKIISDQFDVLLLMSKESIHG